MSLTTLRNWPTSAVILAGALLIAVAILIGGILDSGSSPAPAKPLVYCYPYGCTTPQPQQPVPAQETSAAIPCGEPGQRCVTPTAVYNECVCS